MRNRALNLFSVPILVYCALTPQAVGQTSQYNVRVNGNSLSTSRLPTRVSGEWFLPLAPIARALAAELRLDPGTQSLRVVRVDGLTATYNGATGRILQGSVMAAQVESFRDIQLNIGLENILFPVDGIVALFGVTIRESPDEDVLDIESAASLLAGARAVAGPHLASLDDRYSFATNGQSWEQSLNIRGEALVRLARVPGPFRRFNLAHP
jgi:hypothetical protein